MNIAITCPGGVLILVCSALVSCMTAGAEPPAAAPPSKSILREQAKHCRHLLRTSLVDFYLPACLDRANGGYWENLQAGKFGPTGEKFVTLQARQLWFFSELAGAGIEKQSALSAAKAGFDFLEAKFRDRSHGGYFAKTTDAGVPTDRRKHVYLNSFVLYGLSAYYKASQDPAALAAAQDLFRVLETKAHDKVHGGYIEFFEENWAPIMDRKISSFIGPGGTKTFNTHLHALEAIAELHSVWPDPLVRKRLEELLIINTSTIRLPKYGCNVDGFLPDWTPLDTRQNQRASYGHDVEGVWLCLDAARSLGLPSSTLRSWAEGVMSYSIEHGYDRQHGGFFYTGPLGQRADDTKKEWWVQAEALVSLLEMYKLTGKPEYYALFTHTLAFVDKYQVAKEGSWWASRKADGSPLNSSRSSMWQGAYHNGRAMLYGARLLDELAVKAKD